MAAGDNQTEEFRVEVRAAPLVLDFLATHKYRAYTGWPDRLYLIGTDGRVRYKSAPGPFGFSTVELEQHLGALPVAKSATTEVTETHGGHRDQF